MSSMPLTIPSPTELAEDCEYDQEREISATYYLATPDLPEGEVSGS